MLIPYDKRADRSLEDTRNKKLKRRRGEGAQGRREVRFRTKKMDSKGKETLVEAAKNDIPF